MPIPVTMPALSPTMTEGRLARWRKAEGDTVASGDIIAEIETDKATMELEAVDEGTLGRIVVPEGSSGVKVNAVIAMLLEEGEDKSALDKKVEAKVPIAPKPATPNPSSKVTNPPSLASREMRAAHAERASGTTEGGVGVAPPTQAPATAAPSPDGAASRILASPLARKLARDRGIDLARLKGSGPGGRIVQCDLASAPAAAPAHAKQTHAPLPTEQGTLIPHNNVRRITAERLAEAWCTIPHIYLSVDCTVDALLQARENLNTRAENSYKLSVNDFVVRAVAFALRAVPEMNAQWTTAGTLRLASVDVAIAVALPSGLITPIVRRADQKGLAEISAEVKALAEKARAGKLMPEEYQGGGFSISNLGMFGIKNFGAIVNPPQAGILAVGAADKRPVVQNGALATASVITLTLSCDHRVVDGAIGAKFLITVKGFLEEPMTMLL